MIINFSNFLNEATVYQMRIGDYVNCGGDFRGVRGVKGQNAKITNRRYDRDARGSRFRYFTLEFENPIQVKQPDNTWLETRTLEIKQSQIRNLTHINGKDYERIKAGFSMKYEGSPTFLVLIKTIGFPIKHKFYDFSYLNDDDENSISFLPLNKFETVKETKEDPYKSKFRQQSKIGRVLKRLNEDLNDQAIEGYSNKYKAFWKMMNGDISDKLQVVTGDAITFWYHEVNYAPGGGTLNNSCMRYAKTQERVSFYSKHPDKIALCILLDEKNKLIARALIWKLDKPEGVIFMDRIYFVKNEYELILSNYAKKNNIKTKLSGYHMTNKMSVKISYDSSKEPTLPYLDTLRYDQFTKEFKNY